MECMYCTTGEKIEDLFFEDIGAIVTEVFIDLGGYLQFDQYMNDGKAQEHVHGKRLPILYCPMCGRRLH